MVYAGNYNSSGYGLRGLDRSVKLIFEGSLTHTGNTFLEAKTFSLTDGIQVILAKSIPKQ